ncbi:RES domain-containing protein [Stappia sp. GBMRC 2046]|uniref:RES domain-containing protein n=1 Tax=Stappia sediminis TaxID=2692190 RepID=A0A7X3LTG6_9HYPH|nr:RES family NAD+ phosphorylase [Stappia sediminis]MXN64792.1 RES domain-containing protein [Stappia sediminis]
MNERFKRMAVFSKIAPEHSSRAQILNMPLDPKEISRLIQPLKPDRWLRVMRSEFEETPLGVGPGSSRFSPPDNHFHVLYAACDLVSAIAETVIRDRFEAVEERVLSASELNDWSVAEISTTDSLNLLDLRTVGALRLGLDTDAVGSKSHKESRQFSSELHDKFPNIDGILYRSRLTGRDCIAVYEHAIKPNLTSGEAVRLPRAPKLENALSDLSITLEDDL